MIKPITLISFLCFGFLCYSSDREEVDQYNERTIELLDDLDSCMARADYALGEAEKIGYGYGMAYALYLKGYIHRVQDNLGKAFLVNLKGINILQGVGDDRSRETLIRLYLNTGEILEKHFKYEEAAQYYSEGLSLAQETDLKTWIIDLNYNTGYTYFLKGDLDKAADYIHDSYLQALEEGDEHTIVNSMNLMGLIFRDSYRYDTAILFFNELINYDYKELSADKYKGRAYHNLANTYAQAGDTTSAVATFYQALEHKNARNKPKEIFITEYDLAEIFYFQGDYERAHEMNTRCIQKYEHVRLDPDHYKTFDLARKINFILGDHTLMDQNADRYFEENERFIHRQQELIEIRDQFKMEVLTASFFGELERNKRIAEQSKVIAFILILSTIIIGYLKIRQILIKSIVNKELDKLVRN